MKLLEMRSTFILFATGALATNCYYPNGNLDTSGVAPCSSQGGSCCPLNWECLSNGLCYYDPQQLYGRYTCTDRSWDPDGVCPQTCTYNNTAFGNEAVIQCSDGTWCCDKDRVHYDCCNDEENRIVVDFGSPSTVASISSVASPSSVPATTNRPLGVSTTSPPATSSSTSSTSRSSSSSASSSTTIITTASPTTFTTASAITDSAGLVSTVIVTSIATPTQTAVVAAAASNSPSSNKGTTIGLAVGIPLAVLAGAAIAYLLWRRRRNKKTPPEANYITASDPSDPNLMDMYNEKGPQPGIPEAAGYPIASPPHNNRSSQISELSGSNRFSSNNISPTSPAVSSFKTEAPPSTTTMPAVTEEPAELWGSPVTPSNPLVPAPLAPQHPAPSRNQQQQPTAEDWARRSSYPGFMAYQPPAPTSQSPSGPTPSGPAPTGFVSTGQQYQPYRPQSIESPGSPGPQDQGKLGSGLRVVNT